MLLIWSGTVNPWPSWLDNPQTFSVDEIVDGTEYHHVHNAKQHIFKASDPLSLEAELNLSRSLEEVRRAAEHHAIVLFDDIQLSKIAFQSLLAADLSIPVLLEYLGDRRLNAPMAQNLRALMGWTRLQKHSLEEQKLLGIWLEKQVALGHFSEPELREALVGARRQHQSEEALYSSRLFTWRICKRLWAGIQASTVNEVGTLQLETLKCFLEAASQSPVLHEGRRMGECIVLTTNHTNLRKLGPSIVNLVDRLSKTSTVSSELTFQHRTEMRSFGWFCSVLEKLPLSDSAKIATTITLALTKNICHERAGSRAHLEAWFSVLSRSLFQLARNDVECGKSWLLIERNLLSLDTQTLACYLRLLEDRKIYTFILNHWIPVRLQHIATMRVGPKNRRRSIQTGVNDPSWRDIVQRIDCSSYYPGADDQTTAYLGIVRELRQTYPVQLCSLVPKLLDLLRCLEQSQAILLIVQYLIKCSGGIEPIVVANEVTKHLTSNLEIALDIFKADPRLRVEDCPGLAERIITESTSEHRDVFTLLERDRGLLGSVGSTVHSKRLLHVNSKRVALLHSMALAYANAPHLNPRQAYRKVRRCLDFFRDRPDLLSPDMSQALTKAGILRYLEAGMWVSTIRHNYILGYVKHLEGEEVAHELDRVVWEWRGRNTHLNKGVDSREGDGYSGKSWS